MYVKFGATVHLRASCRNAPSILLTQSVTELLGRAFPFRLAAVACSSVRLDPFRDLSGPFLERLTVNIEQYVLMNDLSTSSHRQRTTLPLLRALPLLDRHFCGLLMTLASITENAVTESAMTVVESGRASPCLALALLSKVYRDM